MARSSADQRLALVDFLLHVLEERYEALRSGMDNHQKRLDRNAIISTITQLDAIFAEGGSVWRVGVAPYRALVRRVTTSAQDQLSAATTARTDAARKMAAAWHACYRHDPDYNAAYRDAVLAVEAAALPVVLPKGGTLGKVLAHIRDTSADWVVGTLDDSRAPSGEVLRSMIALLWHNHERHARSNGQILDLSQEEAEAAINLAVTLVQWFTSGLVKRR